MINFLKKKVLPITVGREETGSRKERISYKKRRDKRRCQRNEKSKGVGKVKLIKGRNLPKREGRDEWESFGASEKSRTLQMKKKVWKTLSES